MVLDGVETTLPGPDFDSSDESHLLDIRGRRFISFSLETDEDMIVEIVPTDVEYSDINDLVESDFSDATSPAISINVPATNGTPFFYELEIPTNDDINYATCIWFGLQIGTIPTTVTNGVLRATNSP